MLRLIVLRYLLGFLITLSISYQALALSYDASFYSQTLYDSRFSGATNESRLRLNTQVYSKRLRPFVSANFSKDLSNGRAPLLTENMVAPGVGLNVEVFSFLYAYGEVRRLYRIQNERRSDSEDESRYGLFAYDISFFGENFFNEFYGESIVVDRVDTKPVTTLSNKLGLRYQPYKWLRPDVFLEAFGRLSPNPGYGPDENELRVASRVSFLWSYWSLQLSVIYAPASNVKKNGVDGLLVLSREVF